jgi:hypothetical protein
MASSGMGTFDRNGNVVNGWASPETLSRGYQYAFQGLYNAIGGTDISTFENYGARQDLQLRNQKALAKYQHELANPTPNEQYIDAKGNPVNIYTKEEMDKYQEEILKYSKYFDKNGLTQEGWKEYNKKIDRSTSTYNSPRMGPTNFRLFMDRITGNKQLSPQKNYGPYVAKRGMEAFNAYKA